MINPLRCRRVSPPAPALRREAMGKLKWRLSMQKGALLAFALLFLLSGSLLLRELRLSAREREANQKLVRRVERTDSRGAGGDMPANTPEMEPEREYLPLLQENSDLAAWLTIPDTPIDYPVMYTSRDPEYYLRRAFDGGWARSGSLFIGAGCVPDGTNIIVYGHNMGDNTMFGSLLRYEGEDYAREHREILYDLIQPDGSYERLRFEVIAAFYSRVYKIDEDGVFRYYYGTDLSDPKDFQSYVEEARKASLYDLGAAEEYGDRLLTLSTCSYHTDDGRFVVVAREKTGSWQSMPD